MKRTIDVVGVGHKKGVSKAGKPYDFHVISGTYVDPDYSNGVAAVEYAVEAEHVANVFPGGKVDVCAHFYNGKTYVDAVIPV